jgi:hypothetical protein
MTGFHSSKFSGFSNRKVADVVVTKTGKNAKIALSHKITSAKAACPKKVFQATGISKNTARATATLSKTLGVYRPDLVEAAVSKFQKIKRSLRRM